MLWTRDRNEPHKIVAEIYANVFPRAHEFFQIKNLLELEGEQENQYDDLLIMIKAVNIMIFSILKHTV